MYERYSESMTEVAALRWVVATGVALVLLATAIHYEALRLIGRIVAASVFLGRARVALAVLGALVAHLIEALLFAAGFWLLVRVGVGQLSGTAGAPRDFVYFSFITYTSLGYGDLVPSGQLRLLAGIEALTGLLLIAWTASFTFYEMQLHWERG